MKQLYTLCFTLMILLILFATFMNLFFRTKHKDYPMPSNHGFKTVSVVIPTEITIMIVNIAKKQDIHPDELIKKYIVEGVWKDERLSGDKP